MIKKGIILAAGIGSRLYPLTKSIPKPMLPVVDRPAIDFIVEEAIQSGIEEIAIVCNHREEVLKDYFSGQTKIYFFHQSNIFGTSYALKAALDFIDNEPFALFLGDEIVNSSTPCIKQLITNYEPTRMDALTGVESVSKELLTQYNCISFDEIEDDTLIINNIVEKPKTDFLSSYTSIGRYIISGNKIIPYLNHLPPKTEIEIPLTNYFSTLSETKRFYGHIYNGRRFDIGSKEKWLNTNLELDKIINQKRPN